MIRSSFLARLSLLLLPVVAALAPARLAQAQSEWSAQDVAVGADLKSRVLWTRFYGGASLWTVGTSGRVEASFSKPLESGWTTNAVTVGGDGRARLMSTNSDGRMELDVVSSTGGLLAKQIYGPFPGWTAIDVACGRDNITRVLWRQNDGAIALWKVDNTRSLGVQINVNHPALPGWTAQNIGVDPAGKVRLAWSGSNGRLRFWVTTPDLKLESSLDQGPFSGYTPFDLSLDSQKTGDGTSRVAWKNTSGRLSLWTTDLKGKRTRYFNFGPYAKFSPRAIALDSGGKTRVVWNHKSGGSDLRTVNPNGSVAPVSSYNFPPTNFVAKTNGKTLGLSWTGSANAQSYRIVRERSGNGERKFLSTTRTVFTDSTVETGVTYYYLLSALTRDVESTYVAASVDVPVPATGGLVNLVDSPAPNIGGFDGSNYKGPFVASDGTGTKEDVGSTQNFDLIATRPGQRYAEVPGVVQIKLSKSSRVQVGDKFVIGSDNASVFADDVVSQNYHRSFASQAGPKTGTIEVTAVGNTSISLRLTDVYMKGPAGQVRLDGGDGATGAFYFNGTFNATKLKPAPSRFVGFYSGPVKDANNQFTDYSVEISIALDGSVSGVCRFRSQNGFPVTGTVSTLGQLTMQEQGGSNFAFRGAITGTAGSRVAAGSVTPPLTGTSSSFEAREGTAPQTGSGQVNTSTLVASNGTGTHQITSNLMRDYNHIYALSASNIEGPQNYPRVMNVSFTSSGFPVVGTRFVVGNGTDPGTFSISVRQTVSLNLYEQEVSTLNPDASAPAGVVEVTAVDGNSTRESISLRFTNISMAPSPDSSSLPGASNNTGHPFILSGTFGADNILTRYVDPVPPTPTTTPTPVPDPTGGKIAFVSPSTSSPTVQEIWVMNANGTNRTQLTNDGTFSKTEPRWSHDGTKLVFSGALPPTDPYDFSEPSQIFTVNADGSGFVSLTTASGVSDSGGRWSPDGSKIVFQRSTFSMFSGTTSQIYVMNADGSNPVNYTASFSGSNYGPEWSPDGRKILFQHNDGSVDGLSGLATIGANGTAPKLISKLYCSHPQWSPDSRKIVFDTSVPNSNVNGHTQDIFVINADGSGASDIISNGAYNYDPEWSPDGSRIVFRVVASTGGDIYVVGADGSGAVNITHSPMYSYGGDSQQWNPFSTKIVFRTTGDFGFGGDIVVANADGSNRINLTNNRSEDSQPQWTIGSVPSPPPASSRRAPSNPSAGSS